MFSSSAAHAEWQPNSVCLVSSGHLLKLNCNFSRDHVTAEAHH